MPTSLPAGRLSCLLIAVLIGSFATLGFLTISRTSPTIDEPIGAFSGYVYLHDGDFRFDVDNPPLWKYWAMIPNLGQKLTPVTLPAALASDNPFARATRTLFQTQGNDGNAFINRSRGMMLLIGVGLAILIAGWSWKLAGPIAGVFGALFYCLDPGFIAHSVVLKADVAIAMLMLGISYMAWLIGKSGRLRSIAGFGFCCAAAVTVKYNGVMLVVIGCLLLMGRALMPQPWKVGRWRLERPFARLVAATAIAGFTILVCVLAIWACYRFRYEPFPGGPGLDLAAEVEHFKRERFVMENQTAPTLDQLGDYSTPLGVRVATLLDRHHVLPQAWLFGLVSIYRNSTTVIRQSYLLGEFSTTGWWYYFPMAALFKTPLATLAAGVLACMGAIVLRRDNRESRLDRWSVICLTVPAILYGISAMRSNTNTGIRHILPVYPPILIGVGVIAARAIQLRLRWMKVAGGVLAIGLIAEFLAAFPYHLSFFNVASRSSRMHLLSDSNFDWGQGLVAVAAWQRTHPDTPLYLAYWGPADPRFFGIEYTNLPGGFAMGHVDPPLDMSRPGVVMVSATLLQGVHQPASIRDYYAPLRARRPDEVIGDSIYLFNWVSPKAP